jgi:hypothetical protein
MVDIMISIINNLLFVIIIMLIYRIKMTWKLPDRARLELEPDPGRAAPCTRALSLGPHAETDAPLAYIRAAASHCAVFPLEP